MDVLIIGAGISGIDVAYRVRERCPELSIRIVEARDRLGGTWDLFRYPGVRSDSDIYTLAFPFRPWRGERSIVDGDELLGYIEDTARATGIDRLIAYETKVFEVDWSSRDARWTVRARRGSEDVEYVARFVVCCAGYYDYDNPHDPGFAAPADLGPTGPFMDMRSGYLARAAAIMPRAGRRYPWAFRQNVMRDVWATNRARLDEDLHWSRVREEAGA